MKNKKLIRVTTVPVSLDKLLEGKFAFIKEHYEVSAVSSQEKELKRVASKQDVPYYFLTLIRKITPIQDLKAVHRLYKFFKKEKLTDLSAIFKLPILSKENIQSNFNDVYTIDKKGAVISKTGGTSGKSLDVYFTKEDFQERFTMLDNFRANFGYELGKKTAWFSGKNILINKDVSKNRFWKENYIYKVKYYSTFHIKKDYLGYYIKDLIDFAPEFLVGFPSNILEIAKYGIAENLSFPKGIVKAIFPTAESITEINKNIIESFFHCGVYNQHASSEGGPFIIECSNRNLHLELQSGVFEVLNKDNEPAQSGKLVVTSFTTHGTPLIRYDIGDSIELSAEICNCGNNNS